MRQLKNASARRQRGVTLIEGILALAISIVMISALVYLLADSQSELRAKNEAERITSFQRVAAQYFMAERETLLDAMDTNREGAGEKACRVNVPASGEGGTTVFSTDKHTCMIDASLLRAKSLMPPGMSETNAHGERLVAIFRRIKEKDASGNEVLSANVDMVVLPVLADGDTYVAHDDRHKENLSIAAMMGATGGVLPDRDRGNCKAERSSSVYEVCGNGWRVRLDDFLTPEQLQAFSSLLPR